MAHIRTEYRINKKGCEMERFGTYEAAKQRLDALSERRPGVYTLQSRSCPTNKVGTLETDCSGRPIWTCWS